MPKVSEHREAKLRSIIRDAIAFHPLITIVDLQKVIEAKINGPIHRTYLTKLVRKVGKEVQMEVSRDTVENRVAAIRETNRILIDGLKRIAFPDSKDPNKPNTTEQRKAMDTIARIENMQAKLEMDFNVFTRHAGTLTVEHNHRLKPVDAETLNKIIATFASWNVVVPLTRKFEATRVIDIKPTEISHEPAKQQPEPAERQPIPTVTRAGLVNTE